jgi:uncharacterized DUF497 family protein
MEFEWDENKRLSNLEKHKVDFMRMKLVFDGRPVTNTENLGGDELRYLTTAEIDEIFYTVVWTQRGETRRLISARRASDAERRNYRSIHG